MQIGAGLRFLSMTDAKKTVLFDRHAALTGKSQIVPFAGWLMPLWYQSISIEHQAVRKQAGLFDCTHMAVLKIAGKNAQDFLNVLATNDVSMLKSGKAQYSYILNSVGDIIDDVIIYCIADDNYMMVVNAANENNVKNWVQKVRTEKVLIDDDWEFDPVRDKASKMPDGHQRRAVSNGVEIKDLKDLSLPDARVDIALQGPASAECLRNIFGADFSKLKSLTFIGAKTKDLDVIISATGYTGAKVSFELFVHPIKAPLLWDTILEKGKNLGVIPCGLGARDSLRIEAGLPLYGHELAGEFNISPFQAGYGWAVKLQKKNFTPAPICTGEANLESAEKAASAQSFFAQPQSKLVRGFIGKEAIAKKAVDFKTEVARLKFDAGPGIRPIRQFDGILNANGVCIGYVLSCAGINDKQIVLALIEKQYNIMGNSVGVYYLARNQGHIQQGRKEKVKAGESLAANLVGKVVERFEKF
jgi:glycine hydroxymethyltransferase